MLSSGGYVRLRCDYLSKKSNKSLECSDSFRALGWLTYTVSGFMSGIETCQSFIRITAKINEVKNRTHSVDRKKAFILINNVRRRRKERASTYLKTATSKIHHMTKQLKRHTADSWFVMTQKLETYFGVREKSTPFYCCSDDNYATFCTTFPKLNKGFSNLISVHPGRLLAVIDIVIDHSFSSSKLW